MWQQVLVYLIVAAAALHAAGKYLPLAWRRRLGGGLARCGLPQRLLAAWLKTGPSCDDGCASCGACDDTPAPPDAKRVIKLHVRH